MAFQECGVPWVHPPPATPLPGPADDVFAVDQGRWVARGKRFWRALVPSPDGRAEVADTAPMS